MYRLFPTIDTLTLRISIGRFTPLLSQTKIAIDTKAKIKSVEYLG